MCHTFSIFNITNSDKISFKLIAFLKYPIIFRLNATEYQDLKDKLHVPVRNLRNIVIQQSISDRFLQAFREQIAQNNVFHKSAELVRLQGFKAYL